MRNGYRLLVVALVILSAMLSADAVETGGYVVQPAYGIYPEYSEIYFTPHTPDTVLLNAPAPDPISLANLPPWILVFLGIATISPGIVYAWKIFCQGNFPLLVGGFRRVSEKNICSNSTREIIYQSVKENPGIGLSDIKRSTGFTYKNLLYHLSILKNFGKITSSECKNTAGFFENSGKFTQEERLMILHLKHRSARKILETVAGNPGISRQELSAHIGISGPSVSWHMQYLLRDHIIEQEKVGNTVHHFIRGPMLAVYHQCIPENDLYCIEQSSRTGQSSAR